LETESRVSERGVVVTLRRVLLVVLLDANVTSVGSGPRLRSTDWSPVLMRGGTFKTKESTPVDKVSFEVRTGRTPMVPLAFWLMGARSTITIDLNPYLKPELVRESVDYIEANQSEIVKLFGDRLEWQRLDALLRFGRDEEILATVFS
jgi:hypothetical protein